MTAELHLHCSPSAVSHARNVQRFLKLDHLGEHIAIHIYSAQLNVCRERCPELRETLSDFLVHERSHLEIFASELRSRGVDRCTGFPLLGWMGSVLGTVTAWFGKRAILACTAAVETIVLGHLQRQLVTMRDCGDWAAVTAVEAIIEDEEVHRQMGACGSGLLYRCVYWLVATGTACVIKVGFYL